MTCPCKCVICGKQEGDKYSKCDLHKPKKPMMCGPPEYVCPKCTEAGWYSTAGSGCSTAHLNAKTNQRKLRDGRVVDC